MARIGMNTGMELRGEQHMLLQPRLLLLGLRLLLIRSQHPQKHPVTSLTEFE